VAERIQEAQRRLSRILRRARLVEDRALARTVRELGERIAHINHGLLQLVRMHDVSNAAFDKPVGEFRHVLTCLIELLGPVNLVCVEDHVWVNGIRVRFDTNPEHAEALGEMLRRHNVGGITYYQELSTDEVRSALRLFATEPAADKARTTLQRGFDDSGLSSIELHPPFQFVTESQGAVKDVAGLAKVAAHALAETFVNLEADRLPNPLPVRRAVNDLIDATEGKDLTRIALEIDNSAPGFARHPLMVTLLAIQIGRAARLSEASLADLGVAGLFHDVGFCELEEGHPASFERHPRAGVRTMLRQRGFHEARIRRLLVTLEHHLPYSGPGGPPSLHSRIIHVADDYDALTRHREGAEPARVPADAVRLMAAHAGSAYDPVVLTMFVNIMGAYPPGSVLKLADGTLVVPISGVRSPETFDKPRCRVVRLPDGSQPQKELWLELAKGGRVVEVLGSQLVRFEPEPAPKAPEPPPKPAPPPPQPTFGNPHLRMPKPPKPNGKE
jgi:HD-GYP domain-containing protein (c-di-GMP phosphodiesterase class II)